MSRKEKLKVYHGLPKNIVDKNTIFYESFDGKITKNYVEDSKYSDRGYVPTLTGMGTNKVLSVDLGTFDMTKIAFTFEFWAEKLVSGSKSGSWGNLIGVGTAPINEDGYANKLIAIVNSEKNKPGGISINGFEKQVIPSSYLQTDDPVHIRVTYDGDKKCCGYVNGVKVGETVGTESSAFFKTWAGNQIYYLYVNTGHNFQANRNAAVISDFKFSNIDRGEYFPNLPQDFIDGKAIIKPIMRQQQIKGDPVCSQETTVKIPAYTEDARNLYSINSSDLTGTLINNPEVTQITNASTWADNTSSFVIKGLASEIIGGVIDTDTALTFLTSYPGIGTRTVKVADTSKLSVGDTIRLYYSDHRWISNEKTIESIDNLTNTITWSVAGTQETFSPSGGLVYVFETTSISSSPIVKSSDGTTVAGTWSGLGTNSAKFTLGTNQSLTGKDLYVTYSLNIPVGNSDFKEMPHSIEKVYDENGNELKISNDIVIFDDFKGKVPKSTINCPHKMYVHVGSSIKKPENITGNYATGFQEIHSQISYNSIQYLDGTTREQAVFEDNGISQYMFEFNILAMLERKIGKINSADKRQWLEDNIDNIVINAHTYGSSGKIYPRFFKNGEWNGKGTITGESIQSYNATYKIDLPGMIQNEGNIFFMLYGDIMATIHVDYISIAVTMKKDDGFTIFYVDNTRSRENPCNPVLIQKETKTVKRYLPSREHFATEVLYYDAKPAAGTLENNIIHSFPFMYISTQGTGSYNPTKNDYFRECLARLGFTKYSSWEYINDVIVDYKSLIGVESPTRFQTVNCDSYNAINRNNIPKNFDFNGSFVALKPTLLLINNEIILNVYGRIFKNGVSSDVVEQHNYKLKNRPLIK